MNAIERLLSSEVSDPRKLQNDLRDVLITLRQSAKRNNLDWDVAIEVSRVAVYLQSEGKS